MTDPRTSLWWPWRPAHLRAGRVGYSLRRYAGRGARPARSPGWLPLLAACLGYFVVILDATVVTVALPALGHELRATLSGLQWVVDGYTLPFAALLLAAGGLTDRLGARLVFRVGVALFTVASAGCALAPDLAVLVLARAAQGVAAALLVPASLVLVRDSYRDQRARSRALGVWAGVAALAGIAGPVAGGLLVSSFGWRAVFLVNLPVGALCFAATVALPPTPRHPDRSLDLAAQAAAVAACGMLTVAVIEGGATGWSDRRVLAGFAFSGLLAGAFLLLEHRSAHPMLPLGLFRRPGFGATTLSGLLLNFGFLGWLFVATLYFQRYRGYDPLRAGVAVLPALAVVGAVSIAAGRVTARTGPRPPMLAGFLVGAVGLAGWLTAGASTPYPVLAVAMLGVGFSTCAMPAATAALLASVPAELAGAASGCFTAARQLGTVLGVALLGSLLSTSGDLLTGLRAAVATAAAAHALGALISALGSRRPAGSSRGRPSGRAGPSPGAIRVDR